MVSENRLCDYVSQQYIHYFPFTLTPEIYSISVHAHVQLTQWKKPTKQTIMTEMPKRGKEEVPKTLAAKRRIESVFLLPFSEARSPSPLWWSQEMIWSGWGRVRLLAFVK